jgi:predicted Holliday junction resolvase-like endonuclease
MELELLLTWAVITTIFLIIIVGVLIKLRKKHENEIEEWKQKHEDDIEELKQSIKKERDTAVGQSRNVLKGKIGEQVSPLMPEFYTKYEPSDARFMGSPIDFVIFKNMSKFDKKTKDEENPIEVVLVDIKIGKSATLSPLQKAIREAIIEKRVSFDVIKPNIELPKQEEKLWYTKPHSREQREEQSKERWGSIDYLQKALDDAEHNKKKLKKS